MIEQVRHRLSITVVVLVALVLIARFLPGPRTIDDAFITFRYSRNIVEGQGFVYNPGERVLGTTTPLFTLLMAAASLVTGQQDFQWYAIVASAAGDSVTAVLLYSIARRLTGQVWDGALLGALWAIAPMSVTFAVGGMETSVNILWMVAATWCFVNGREMWTAAFAALGLLTRIDAILWIAPLGAYLLVERWRAHTRLPDRIPWRAGLLAAGILAPWLLFSVVYFGSPVPRSLSAKSLAYVMPPGSALTRLIQAYATPFFEFETFGPPGALAGVILYSSLSIIGVLYIVRRQPRLLPFVVYPWLYLAVFSISNPLIFRWYMAPPMPALMLTIVAGVWALVESLHKAVEWRWLPAGAATVLALIWGGLSLNAWDIHPDHGPDRPAPTMAWHQIELLYQQIGLQLSDEYGVSAGTVVASGDIGAVGYFSRATILDTVGLVTPQASRYYPASPTLIVPGQNYAIPPQLITDFLPPYLVAMEAMVRLGLEQDPAFQANYQLVVEIPTDFYGTGMRLYQRTTP